MDSPTSASDYAALARKDPHKPAAGTVLLVSKNVVYVGPGDEAARRAMNSLRK